MLPLSRLRRHLRTRLGPTPFRQKNLLAATVFCFVLFYLFNRPDDTPGKISDSTVLERHMNFGSSKHPWTLTKSSVDWGKVEYRYPPSKQLTQVPKPRDGGKLPRVQHQFETETPEDRQTREQRRKAVLELTRKCWDSYRKYAWKRDALLPLSGAGKDQFSGWAATLVDSLDTLWIMGLRDEFDEAVAAVAEIDFGSSTSGQINIFETNIRYLGGLMAAYDLSGREVLLQKAVELGDLIYGGFNTVRRMPVDNIDLDAAKKGTGLTIESQVVSASPGTLTLEMTRLSQLTGDPKSYDAISNVVELFYRGQNQTALPGLFPMWVSMAREDVTTGSTFTLGGCADSLYEYFPKMFSLLSGAEPRFLALTRGFLDAAKRHLFFRPMVPNNDDILMSGNVDIDEHGKPHMDPETEHLTCFIGGTFALAGRLLGSEEDVEVGARLTRGCVYAYKSFPTGMMPERLNMVVCEEPEPCRWDEAKWQAETQKRREYKPHLPKGFTTAKDPRYILRPEAIEGVFYMWRITGDVEWREAAWDMFEAVAKGTATELGSAAVLDVTVAKPQLPQEDYMEASLVPSCSVLPLETWKKLVADAP